MPPPARGCFAFSLLAWLAWTAVPAQAAALSPDDARHLLARAAYGPAPGELAALQAQGLDAWLAAQLSPAAGEPPALQARLDTLDTLALTPLERARRFRAPLKAAKRERQAAPEALREARQAERELLHQAQAARLWRAVGSPHQLREVMVEFWADHFNVYARKRTVGAMLGDLEERVLRPQALGRFRALLGAVARHPAMLDYLDNWRNSRPTGQGGRFGGLNENYARELLELHTLGVQGGYTQTDVGALATVLTGWGLPRGWPDPKGPDVDASGFRFDPRRHVPGDKRVLGTRIPGGGVDEGERVLDMLAAHPATAHFLARKLAQRFVGDAPPEPLVTAVAEAFSRSGGRLDATLHALLRHPGFWAREARGTRFKTPYRLVVSTHRALGQLPEDAGPSLRALERLGQPLHGRVTPDGWPVTRAAWLNPDAMARRVGLAAASARGAQASPEAVRETLGEPFGTTTLAAVAAAPAGLRVALLLGAPEFQQH
ncbi:MAG: DUF1800 domain-containing protein [Candidatus Sericytochromatia bacterium]|nr:DUF1800 domain-containing protein [Candidatus Sericytochromatia bacterium]